MAKKNTKSVIRRIPKELDEEVLKYIDYLKALGKQVSYPEALKIYLKKKELDKDGWEWL